MGGSCSFGHLGAVFDVEGYLGAGVVGESRSGDVPFVQRRCYVIESVE